MIRAHDHHALGYYVYAVMHLITLSVVEEQFRNNPECWIAYEHIKFIEERIILEIPGLLATQISIDAYHQYSQLPLANMETQI